MSRILASWSLFLVLIKIFSLDCETFCFHKVLYIVGTKLTTKKIGKAIFGYFIQLGGTLILVPAVWKE